MYRGMLDSRGDGLGARAVCALRSLYNSESHKCVYFLVAL